MRDRVVSLLFVVGLVVAGPGNWPRAAGLAGPKAVVAAAAEVVDPAAESEYVLDVRGDESLVLVLPERLLVIDRAGEREALNIETLAARFGPAGHVLVIDTALALHQIETSGDTLLLGPGGANGPLFLSPDGTRVAYLKPADFIADEPQPLTNGIAVLDLGTRVEQVLFMRPGITVLLYGWQGDDLVIEVPTWDPQTLASPGSLELARLEAVPGALPQPWATLPRLAPGSQVPQTSFDQRYLAYDSVDGVVVTALDTRAFQHFSGAAAPQWTAAGLQVNMGPSRQALAWAPDALDKSAPVAGTLPMAPAVDLGLVPVTRPEQPPLPKAPMDVLFIRPVAANVAVSAYYDLNRNSGAWRSWKGDTGSAFRYGGSYDQHSGTDYDSVTGHPIYAAAPGLVKIASVLCANTYPTTSSFGTYLKLEHGTLADGQRYWTTYGHLKCDSLLVGQGATVGSIVQQMAQMGNTGWSTGDHLHLQVYRGSEWGSIDPYDLGMISDAAPLRTHGSVVGQVVDSAGNPLAGVPLKLVASGTNQAAATGADGRYRFATLPAGPARVWAQSGAFWGEAYATILGNQEIGAPDLVLEKCVGSLAGQAGCPPLAADGAAFVADISYADGTQVQPGQVMWKSWQLRNTGTSAWAGAQLSQIAGADMALPGGATVSLPVVSPGQELTVTVGLAAPMVPGLQRSYWRLRDAQGVFFGPTIWIEVNSQPGAPVNQGALQPAGLWPRGHWPLEKAAASPQEAATAPVCSLSAALAGESVSVSWTVDWGGGVGVVEVQFNDSGRDGWRPWLAQVPGAHTQAMFAGLAGHRYGFRCRATNAGGESGAWPGAAQAEALIGGGATGADLRITSLAAANSPGGGVTARLTIVNQGQASTGHGFYADLYQGYVPSGPGDYQNSVRVWVAGPLGPGAATTLAARLTAGSGEVSSHLYALVDSTAVVAETDEGNNRWVSGVPFCAAAVDNSEPDDEPNAAGWLSAGVPQTRNLGGPAEQDWMAINLAAGRSFTVRTTDLGPGADTVVEIYQSNPFGRVAFNDDPSSLSLAGQASAVTVSAARYFALVRHANPGAGGCLNSYTVTLVDNGPVSFLRLPLVGR